LSIVLLAAAVLPGMAAPRLLSPEEVLAGFTNAQSRVAVIVNLVPPAPAVAGNDPGRRARNCMR